MKSRLSIFALTLLVLASCQGTTSQTQYREALTLSVIETIEERQFRYEGRTGMPASGDIRVRVIPIEIPDHPFPIDYQSTLDSAFNGDPTTLGWESVASFYQKSSYGKLRLQFDISSKYILPNTSDYYEEYENYGDYYAFMDILPMLDGGDFFNVDANQDQVIDSVIFIYSTPSNYELFPWWAWVSTFDDLPPLTPNDWELDLGYYMWAGYDFLFSRSLGTDVFYDPTTYIHEVGHLFGLQDYYNTDSNSIYQSTGFFDMMDHNLGDHSSFSKYLLNWARPYIVNEPQDITIRSFTETGDFILMPTSSFNGTPYDEYILVEYFTSNGLNDSSSFSSYVYTDKDGKSRIFYYPNHHGLRIYHIDARLVYYSSRSSRIPLGFVDNLTAENLASYSNLYVGLANDNSPNSLSKKMLCHLLSAEGESDFQNGIAASNSTLFTYGDTFGTKSDEYYDFTFNKNGENLPLSISITKMGTNEITLSFEQRA